ncbi:carboxypeptidase-like regulatory domain-containing protein [Hymenobacter endophyticus]|uniref:Carboxypeptidase-like regulatory domain-containing protein n=1 Tax=Hymenobacter endophyticus TaxID=3076335 RepID=A0ABU3TEV8_9BACT|nr:carboxypeptidase-like regulatory domain-containing protein [Hymenobacter endophyticus]MDU0369916.1 carboxypeptidase-like regulatory domain-containing protein [Hymenobacter endophyticus]
MPRALTVAIPQPCRENWAAMTPAAQGRHCAACNKVVVDFTRMTDTEVVAYFTQTSGQSCGRFRTEQLQRPLRLAIEAPVSRRWLAVALAVLGVGAAGPAAAQGKSAVPQEQRILPGKTAAPIPASPTQTTRGRVTDAATGEGLPGVSVLLKGTTMGTSTNSDGSFELVSSSTASSQLIFSSIGYFTQQVALADFKGQASSIKLVVDEKAMNERIVVGGYCMSRWYTPRGLWQRLTQPLRR